MYQVEEFTEVVCNIVISFELMCVSVCVCVFELWMPLIQEFLCIQSCTSTAHISAYSFGVYQL